MGGGTGGIDEAEDRLGKPRRRVFGAPYRLRTRAQFAYMRRCGRRAAGRRCVVVAATAADGSRRVGYAISRRYSRRAVDRNRARRLLREAYRLLLPELRDRWLLFIPRYRMAGASLGDVLPEIRCLLARLEVLEERDGGGGEACCDG